MTLTHKHIADLNYMNVAAQRAQLGSLIKDIINNNGNVLDDDLVYDLNNMNRAAQNVKLGKLFNDIIDGTATNITAKQAYDLNNMNVAAQNVQFGNLINDLMDTDNFDEGAKLNPFNNVDDYIANYATFQGKDVYLELDGEVKQDFSMKISAAASGDSNPPKLHITINNCEFDGNIDQFPVIEASNIQELIIKNTRFIDNQSNCHETIKVISSHMNDVEITLDDCVFINSSDGCPVVIMLSTDSSIKNITIKDCYFDNPKCSADVKFGAINDVEAIKFPATFAENNTSVRLTMLGVPASGESTSVVFESGRTYTKDVDSVITSM